MITKYGTPFQKKLFEHSDLDRKSKEAVEELFDVSVVFTGMELPPNFPFEQKNKI